MVLIAINKSEIVLKYGDMNRTFFSNGNILLKSQSEFFLFLQTLESPHNGY